VLVASFLLEFSGAACTAPLVERAGLTTLPPLPEGMVPIRCRTEDGVELSGIHVDGGPDAPLILHLLPRGASATNGRAPFAGFHDLLTALGRAGWSQLVIDYRGVGSSTGARDPDALALDARAMLRCARELVDGDTGRIVIRASSLGTLAAACVIGEGAEFPAIVLIAPVDARTVVRRAARERLGAVFGGVASLVLRRPDLPSLRDVLPSIGSPTLVLLAEDDPLLPERDHLALRAAASAANVRFRDTALDHEQLVLRTLGFALDEEGGRVDPTLIPVEHAFLLEAFARRRPAPRGHSPAPTDAQHPAPDELPAPIHPDR
jgi:pimeloyl-ACP methyl ester carboxylesterase